MNSSYGWMIGLSVLGIGFVVPAVANDPDVEARPVVTVSTTLLGSAVAAIAGPDVEVNLLMPPDTCPGHFALSPRQALRTAESALFLTHGFEPFMRAVGARFTGVHRELKVDGNAMIPDVHQKLAREVHAVLADLLPERQPDLATRYDDYLATVKVLDRELRETLSALNGIPVLTALMNKDLVTWMGASVVEAFPRDEALTGSRYQDLLDRAKAGNVKLVIDNVQSSGRLGRRLADTLGVPLVLTSNFPASSSPDGYPEALRVAVADVMSGLGRTKNGHVEEGKDRVRD